MNALRLGGTAAASDSDSDGRGPNPATLRFWARAGAGFMLGAGAVYVAGQICWLVVITEFPSLWFLHALTRF